MADENFKYDWTTFGTQVGVLVKNSNLFDTQISAWDTKKTEADTAFGSTALDREKRDEINRKIEAVKASLLSGQANNTEEASDYFLGLLRTLIGSSFSALEDILTDLKNKMTADSQTIDANLVGVKPYEWAEVNDGSDQITNYEDIRGLSSSNLDASLKLYISIVDDGGGDFHLEGFNDSAKAGGDKIFTSATFTGVGNTVLSEANSSGISGTLQILAASPAADSDIEVTFAFNTSIEGSGNLSAWSASQMAKDGEDLRIECVTEDPQGAETWAVIGRSLGQAEDNATTGTAYPSSLQKDNAGLNFTINADTTFTKANDGGGLLDEASFANLTGVKREHVDANRKIHVTVTGASPYTIKGYKDSGLAAEDQIFESATYTGTGDVVISESNSSGIGGTLTVDALGTDSSIDVVMALRFRKGDTFYLKTDSDDAGLIASWFRDFFEVALPTATGGAETIADPS